MQASDVHMQLTALFKAGQLGDAKAYEQFLRMLAPLLRSIVTRKVPVSDTEDVVQEVLISVHKARATFDGQRALMPWLFAITQYRVADYLRKVYATGAAQTLNIADFSDSLADVTKHTPANEYTEDALKYASERERTILTLMHVEGYTAKETGAQLGMGESAVKVAAHRAMKKIREALK